VRRGRKQVVDDDVINCYCEQDYHRCTHTNITSTMNSAYRWETAQCKSQRYSNDTNGYWTLPFDAHCCHMGISIKHPVPDTQPWASECPDVINYKWPLNRVPDRVKLSFVIVDIRALWRSELSVRVPGCQKYQMTGLSPVWHRMLYSIWQQWVPKGLKERGVSSGTPTWTFPSDFWGPSHNLGLR